MKENRFKDLMEVVKLETITPEGRVNLVGGLAYICLLGPFITVNDFSSVIKKWIFKNEFMDISPELIVLLILSVPAYFLFSLLIVTKGRS
jgi:hypothetical protein